MVESSVVHLHENDVARNGSDVIALVELPKIHWNLEICELLFIPVNWLDGDVCSRVVFGRTNGRDVPD